MKKLVILLLLFPFYIEAQNEKGQITVNAGVGYSPEFNGDIDDFGAGPAYPVGISNTAQEGFGCSSILPAINGTIDYGISNACSIGLASSYQSEEVTLPYNTTFDKITRINLTIRILGHLNKNHSHFDHYIGIRAGFNYWGDIPPPNPGYPPSYFLTNPNSFVPCFQVFYGMRIYFTNNVGIHFEVGIGQSYLAEGGLTFRINTTHKSSAPVQSSYGGHEAK